MNDINHVTIIAKISLEFLMLKDTIDVSSEQVLVWAQTVETQRSQKTVLESIRDAKDFSKKR